MVLKKFKYLKESIMVRILIKQQAVHSDEFDVILSATPRSKPQFERRYWNSQFVVSSECFDKLRCFSRKYNRKTTNN